MDTAPLFAPAPAARRPRRGRPPVADDPIGRRRDVDIARYRLVLRVPAPLVAAAFGITDRSVRKCVRRARDYPEAAHLFRGR